MTATAGRRGDRRLNPRTDPWSPWLHVDVLTLLAVAGLSVVGVVMVYSATRGADPATYDTSFLERQAAFAVAGVGAMIGAAIIPYDRLRSWAPALFGMGILGLVVVLSPLGVERNGAQAWFEFAGFQLQPSEFLKAAYIVVLASFVARFDGDLTLIQLGSSLAIGVLPLGLIMLQPDVGTALVFIAITMGMLLIGGARARHIVALTLLGVIAVLGIWNAGILQDYQQDRLTSFIDPDNAEIGGPAYQQTQSQIAIGSGGLTGQGWGQGGQTRGGFVPEQHTDFIFAVVGEELGFLGAAGVLGLFGLLIWRIWRTALFAGDLFGSLVCIGVLTMFVFQMFQSVGMTTGIMPITGIPVPFLSYGGSSAMTSFVAIGLVLNVGMRKHVVR
jgi:rod shape determining protein RodA